MCFGRLKPQEIGYFDVSAVEGLLSGVLPIPLFGDVQSRKQYLQLYWDYWDSNENFVAVELGDVTQANIIDVPNQMKSSDSWKDFELSSILRLAVYVSKTDYL